LVSPSTESPLEAEIAELFIKDHKKWEKNVRDFVKKNKGK
jgi:ubiquitin-protein ligase